MEKLSLLGEWKLTGGGVECTAVLPGDFHSALLSHNKIPDPYTGFNEQEVQWVGRTDWTISRSFYYKKKAGQRAYLVLTQADTFFTALINGREAGSGQNQFARHRFEISGLLQDGRNEISIVFESPEKKALEKAESLPYPAPYMKYDVYSPHRNLVRKCQCHSGWDWGPCLMVSGIYGGIYIESTSLGYIENSTVTYSFPGKEGKHYRSCTAKIRVSFFSLTKTRLRTSICIKNKTTAEETWRELSLEVQNGANLIEAELELKNPDLWKTSGELKEEGRAENTVYELSITVSKPRHNNVTEKKQLCIHRLRAVSQRDSDGGKEGRSLYFENDGRKIFAKGSNWIPADALPSRMTAQRYEDLLRSAVEANQNTIRVWGGGIYEADVFYELCDRLGLIVWQDCMFACSTYPMTREFIQEVEKELDYQVPRLQSHACIGIWCGNNENFGALNWFKESNENRVRYLVDYDRLYNGIIGKRISELDPDRLYWPSSPCSGPDDFADNWHADNMGDMHYWSVWHERKDFEAYLSITPRFVSEFGYEAFPSLECIEEFAEKKDFNFTSRLMEYHQRSPSGNSIMIENFARYFPFPSGFENMIYLSQVQQALAIKTAVGWWRALRPHCMGTLVWQLNDVWPCPSWSSLEYSGKWKLLHYEEKKIFDNLYMPLFIKDGTLQCVICNDTAQSVSAELEISFVRFDGTELKPPLRKNAECPADSSMSVISEKISGEHTEEYFVMATARIKQNGNGQEQFLENFCFPALYKHCSIKEPDIKCSIEPVSQKTAGITLTAKNPAFFVSLDTKIRGRFSDNMLILQKDSPRTITFTAEKRLSLSVLRKSLRVYDLYSVGRAPTPRPPVY